jgi:hypothetical protein
VGEYKSRKKKYQWRLGIAHGGQKSRRNGIEVSIRAKEKIIRNIQAKALRPSGTLAKRSEAEEACSPRTLARDDG